YAGNKEVVSMLAGFFEKLTDGINRRGFLANTAIACSAIVLALLGLDGTATATKQVGCCSLCNPFNCTCAGAVCQWSWVCQHCVSDLCRCATCIECYTAAPCDGSCRNIKCSIAGGGPNGNCFAC